MRSRWKKEEKRGEKREKRDKELKCYPTTYECISQHGGQRNPDTIECLSYYFLNKS